MSRIFIKPAKGMLVRDPITKIVLPEKGRDVVSSTYWRRRLKDGSVIKAKKVLNAQNPLGLPKELKK